MASWRRVKKQEKTKLLNYTRKAVKEANNRLSRLASAGMVKTWASNKLMNKLDSASLDVVNKERTKKPLRYKGRKITTKPVIRLKKSLSKTDLIAINKGVKNFLKSETSTVEGVNKAIQNNIEGIRKKLSIGKKEKVTKEDATFYYEMFKDKDFNYLTDRIKYDALWDQITKAKEKKVDEETWLDMIDIYTVDNDETIRNKALSLYEKYIN